MSSYLSTILTHTTSKYATLRRTLTSSEADGDTDDDSHISRVLRAYYTENNLPLPPWLPPDPKRAASMTSTFTSSLRGPGGVGGGAGGGGAGGVAGQGQGGGGGGGGGGRGGLADLWEGPARGGSPAPSMSLRRPMPDRAGTGGSFRGVVEAAMASQSSQPQPQSSGGSREGARPLPSQRAGSYQSVVNQQQGSQMHHQNYNNNNNNETGGPPSSAGGGTAQERLKARLWGRAGSSTSLRADAANSRGQQSPNPYAARDAARDRYR